MQMSNYMVNILFHLLFLENEMTNTFPTKMRATNPEICTYGIKCSVSIHTGSENFFLVPLCICQFTFPT